jgi:hypothetical protein
MPTLLPNLCTPLNYLRKANIASLNSRATVAPTGGSPALTTTAPPISRIFYRLPTPAPARLCPLPSVTLPPTRVYPCPGPGRGQPFLVDCKHKVVQSGRLALRCLAASLPQRQGEAVHRLELDLKQTTCARASARQCAEYAALAVFSLPGAGNQGK